MPSIEHSTVQHENNGCELSHQLTQQQERQMWRFKSQGKTQRFLSCYSVTVRLSNGIGLVAFKTQTNMVLMS